ncbi:hypothetical protein CGERO_00530 [Corynebacterium gerontici]|uniref:Uncharacterized protein n=2 Tax=Corynebacterium gerontici TaxID=2079234 RepID=A0A3G6J2W0_9CORY|nr:hypothetical protein CGERO_00530 [Corynebacterium gerontici]
MYQRVGFALGEAPSPKHVALVVFAAVSMLLGYAVLIGFPLIYGKTGLLPAFLFGAMFILPSGWWFWHMNRRNRMAMDPGTYAQAVDRKWRFVLPTAALAFIAGCFTLTGLERLGPVDPPQALGKIDSTSDSGKPKKTDSSKSKGETPTPSFALQSAKPSADTGVFNVPERARTSQPSIPILQNNASPSAKSPAPTFEPPRTEPTEAPRPTQPPANGGSDAQPAQPTQPTQSPAPENPTTSNPPTTTNPDPTQQPDPTPENGADSGSPTNEATTQADPSDNVTQGAASQAVSTTSVAEESGPAIQASTASATEAAESAEDAEAN